MCAKAPEGTKRQRLGSAVPSPGASLPLPGTHTATVWGTQGPFLAAISNTEAVLLPALLLWFLSVRFSGAQGEAAAERSAGREMLPCITREPPVHGDTQPAPLAVTVSAGECCGGDVMCAELWEPNRSAVATCGGEERRSESQAGGGWGGKHARSPRGIARRAVTAPSRSLLQHSDASCNLYASPPPHCLV